MSSTHTISYRGRRIPVEYVTEIGGDLDDLREFSEVLFRADDGDYYLEQERAFQMPPNAEDCFSERMFVLRGKRHSPEIARLRDWRQRLTRPRKTIKRITEKTALLWCVHQLSDDPKIKARLREAVNKL